MPSLTFPTTFPILRSPRLLMRQLSIEDVPQVFAMRFNPNTNRFIARSTMSTEEEAVQLIERSNKAWEEQQGIAWAAQLRGEGAIIGACGFNRIDYPNLRAEIGGELSPDYWGKGFPAEAVQVILDWGFGSFGLHAVEARVMGGNRSAIALLEHLGFEKEGHFKKFRYFEGRWEDVLVYTLFKH